MGEWLAAARVHLLDSGITELELELLQLRDVEGLTLEVIGAKFGKSRGYAFRHYQRLRRRLRHPARQSIVPPFFR